MLWSTGSRVPGFTFWLFLGHGLKQPLLDTVHSDLRLSVPRSEPCVHRQGASCDSPSNAGGTFSFLGLRMAGMGVQSEADTGS